MINDAERKLRGKSEFEHHDEEKKIRFFWNFRTIINFMQGSEKVIFHPNIFVQKSKNQLLPWWKKSKKPVVTDKHGFDCREKLKVTANFVLFGHLSFWCKDLNKMFLIKFSSTSHRFWIETLMERIKPRVTDFQYRDNFQKNSTIWSFRINGILKRGTKWVFQMNLLTKGRYTCKWL